MIFKVDHACIVYELGIPFNNGHYIQGNKAYLRLFSSAIQSDEGIAYYFHISIESVAFVNQVLPHIHSLPNDFVDNNPLVIATDRDYAKLNDHNWSSIRVNEGLFWTRKNELVLNNYPHDNFLHIQEDSFSNMSSLTITNLPELRVILCEDTSFWTTTSFNISSII